MCNAHSTSLRLKAGTLSGNPLAMTAGIETMKILKEPGTYEQVCILS